MALEKKKDLFYRLDERGLTLIEILISLATVAILISVIFFSAFEQVAKGRDAQRKAELAKLQKTLEDYYNDSGCYPDSLTFGASNGHELEGYLTAIYADPLNNNTFNYLYTYDTTDSCHQWYKVYSRLEKESDKIIDEVGCGSGCGPDDNYNYWVSSPNIASAERQVNEYWPEDDLPVGPTNSPTPSGGEPTNSPTPTPTLPSGATSTPTPTPTGILPYNCFIMEGCSVACASSPTLCGQCCDGTTKECIFYEDVAVCCYTTTCPLE